MIPKLTSRRLVLIPYEVDLVRQEHINWLNDKELMRFSEQRHFTHTLESQHEYVSAPDRNRMLWLIKTAPYPEATFATADIGTMSAYIDPYNELANLGILIGRREYHGLGFGTEAWSTVMEFLLSNGMHKVEAGCREDNKAMHRIAMNTGMKLEGTIPGHFKTDLGYVNLRLYGKCGIPYFVEQSLPKKQRLGTYAA